MGVTVHTSWQKRRLTFRKCIATFLGLYLLSLCLFHGIIVQSTQKLKKDDTYQSSDDTENYFNDVEDVEFSSNISSVTLRKTKSTDTFAQFANGKVTTVVPNKSNHVINAENEEKIKDSVYKLQENNASSSGKTPKNIYFNSNSTPSENSMQPCPVVEHGHFQMLKLSNHQLSFPELYVYSAFFDNRTYPDSYIRIVSLTVTKDSSADSILNKTRCRFYVQNQVIMTRIKKYEFCENHGRRYGGYLLSCKVPEQLPICSIEIVLSEEEKSESQSIVVPVQHPQARKVKFTVCIPPLYGSIPTERLVEFIELNRIFGARLFHFYVLYEKEVNMSNTVAPKFAQVLDYYKSQGIVTYDDWHLPVENNEIWYKGQSIALNDCHYRHIGATDYLAAHDIDEYIVPQRNDNWDSMVQALWVNDTSGFCINSVFLPPGKSKAKLQTLEVLSRTKNYSEVRTKCLVKPESVFELGIHHISKWVDREKKPQKAPPEMALVFHYRNCLRNFNMNCNGMQHEMSIMKYSQQLKSQYNATMCKLGFCETAWTTVARAAKL